MADEANNQPAGVVAGQPAEGKEPVAAAAEPEQQQASRSKLAEGLEQYKREVADLKAKIQTYEDTAKKAAADKLAEQGKWQELAQNHETDAKGWRTKYEQAQIQNALYVAGHKEGVNDPLDLAALTKLDGVDVNDPRALVAAAEKAVADLKTAKPYLFGTTTPPTTTPAADPKTTTYPTPQANPGGSEPFDPSKVTAEDVRSGKLTREQLARVAGNGAGVDFMGRPLR